MLDLKLNLIKLNLIDFEYSISYHARFNKNKILTFFMLKNSESLTYPHPRKINIIYLY